MEELDTLRERLHRLTEELIADCPFCTAISSEPLSKTPVSCTKWSGSSSPVSVNAATCLSCGEYRKTRTLT